MKLITITALSMSAVVARAFSPAVPPPAAETGRLIAELPPPDLIPERPGASRRSVISLASGFLLGTLAAPKPGHSRTANPFFEGDVNYEPSQMSRGDKIDINGAFVVDYKQLPGMYPTAAGKIASHGPYAHVKDIYDIPGLTDHDRFVFKKYQAELTVLPPGRMFDERINQRQST